MRTPAGGSLRRIAIAGAGASSALIGSVRTVLQPLALYRLLTSTADWQTVRRCAHICGYQPTPGRPNVFGCTSTVSRYASRSFRAPPKGASWGRFPGAISR